MYHLAKYLILSIVFACTLDCANAQILGKELLDGKEEVEVTFDYKYGFIIVRVYLHNFLPMNFILDTGAEHIILFKKEIADLLGFEYEKRINLIGSDLNREVYAFISRNIPLTLEGTPPVTRDLIILENDFLNLESMVGQPIDGILGSRFFRGLILDINYKKNKLTLRDRDKFKLPDNSFYELAVQVHNHKPYLNTSITTVEGETVPVKLLVDTGAALPFLLFLNTHPSLHLPDNFIKGNLGRGLGGDLEGYLGKVKELKIKDSLYFRNIVTSFQNLEEDLDSTILQNRNGLIGNQILSRFHVIFDIIGEKVYLKPEKNYNKEFEYDKSGLILFAFGPNLNKYYVKDIIENSPADEVGIKKGDIIKKIGLLPAQFYNLHTISKKLQKKEGKKIRLTLMRGGKKIKKTIILRDLIGD